jgi:hypothetical protein
MGNDRTFVHSGNNADGDFKASRYDDTGSNNHANPDAQAYNDHSCGNNTGYDDSHACTDPNDYSRTNGIANCDQNTRADNCTETCSDAGTGAARDGR